MSRAWLLASVLLAVGVGPAFGQNAPAEVKKQVEQRLAELKAKPAVLEVIDDASVRKTLPHHTFVVVRFPLWPIARVPPDPLKSQNLFVGDKDGKLLHLTDAKGLEDLFRRHVSGVKKVPDGFGVVKAWMRLSQEFVQDGYYKFTVIAEGGSMRDNGLDVVGKATVAPEMGNKGFLTATLVFGADGKLERVVEENKVIRGIRPKCQATLLLHENALVRDIAEQDLLVMGRAIRAYLLEQRAQASPELQRAIDRVWQRIVDEGR